MAHDPAPGDTGDERRLLIAMVLTGAFMVVEAIAGVLTGSLALLADAGHMFTDTAALALAWTAFRIGRRVPDPRRTYGYHRFQVLAAFVNGVTLIAVVGWIAIEAIRRLMAPIEILGGMMLAVAVAGLVVNLATFAVLQGGDRGNLNVHGAALHVLGDLLGSVAAIVAGAVILATAWTPIDPLLSLFVAGLIARSAWRLVRKSAHILLEGAPDWLDVAELRARLTGAIPEVEDIHHVHAWSLTTERPLLTLHAKLRSGADSGETLAAITGFLRSAYGISHATVQLEPGGCPDGTR
ncbi:MAG: cation diffusion facilitator family transporter [Rhodospirillales bacterium]